jgi:hypothetical protein
MKYHVLYNKKDRANGEECDVTLRAYTEGLERQEVKGGAGAATALFIGSIMLSPEGGASYAFFSVDGRSDGPLSDEELWKFWTILAAELQESPTLGEAKKIMCSDVFARVSDCITKKSM